MTDGNISIAGLDKGAVLAALYNASKPQGMGLLNYTPEPMTADEGNKILDGQRDKFIDYLKGRIIAIDFSGDSLRPVAYDYDNGNGAVEKVINELRATKRTNTALIEEMHDEGTAASIEKVRKDLGESKTTFGKFYGIPVVNLGLPEEAISPLRKIADKEAERLYKKGRKV